MKFSNIVSDHYTRLQEQGPGSLTPAPNTAVGNNPALATANAAAQAAEQQVAQGAQNGPEQHFVNGLKGMDFKNSANAIKTLNTAMKNAGNIPGMQEFWQNVGYDPNNGFVYNPVQPGQQNQTTPQQPAPGNPPGVSQTNTTIAANRPR